MGTEAETASAEVDRNAARRGPRRALGASYSAQVEAHASDRHQGQGDGRTQPVQVAVAGLAPQDLSSSRRARLFSPRLQFRRLASYQRRLRHVRGHGQGQLQGRVNRRLLEYLLI